MIFLRYRKKLNSGQLVNSVLPLKTISKSNSVFEPTLLHYKRQPWLLREAARVLPWEQLFLNPEEQALTVRS